MDRERVERAACEGGQGEGGEGGISMRSEQHDAEHGCHTKEPSCGWSRRASYSSGAGPQSVAAQVCRGWTRTWPSASLVLLLHDHGVPAGVGPAAKLLDKHEHAEQHEQNQRRHAKHRDPPGQ
eukprot:365130-Chlamydomonas_euryale.AAC.17